MNKIDMRNQKRREMVEAIVNWQEPIHEVARIFDVPQRTIFAGRLPRIQVAVRIGEADEVQ